MATKAAAAAAKKRDVQVLDLDASLASSKGRQIVNCATAGSSVIGKHAFGVYKVGSLTKDKASTAATSIQLGVGAKSAAAGDSQVQTPTLTQLKGGEAKSFARALKLDSTYG